MSQTTTGAPSGAAHPNSGAPGGAASSGRVDALIDGATRLTDAVQEIGEALVAAVVGAVFGAGGAARAVWVADRPRRQQVRQNRRRKWIRAGGGWWWLAVLELIAVGAWLGARATFRAARGVPAGAAGGARTGWTNGRGRAQGRHSARRSAAGGRPAPGAGTAPGPGPVPAWGTPRPAPGPTPGPAAQAASEPDAVQVTVKVTPPPDRDPGWTPGYSQEPNGTWIETGAQGERRIIRDPDELAYVTGAPNPDPDTYHHYFTADLWPVVTAEQDAARHLAGDGPIDVGDPSAWRLNPLIGADWRANALREAGYKGPIDQDGHARASMELGSRELTADEIYAAIAAGGYPPGTDPGPVPDQEAIDRRKAALRAAGWAGPISGDGHAIHGQPSYGGLAGALAAIEELATSPRSCCMCVPDPTESEWDQVCDCRCVVGEGAPRDQCTCGPWDLDKALAEDDAAEDRGDLDGDDRATCHQCKDWADHAHAPFSGQRVPKTTYYLQQELLRHPRWQEWQADPDPSAWTVATAATQSPVGHPADGSGPPAPDGSTNKDQENDMPQGSTMTMKTGSDGTTVEGDTQVGGELTAIGDLAAENEQQTTYVQAIQVMKEDLHGWTKGLAEQVDGADWGTAEVSAAAAALSEAQSVGQIREGITSLIAAGEQAKQLGELLDAGGARGKVSGLRPR